MDTTAYINSGVLELYVLDRLSPDERRGVERYAEQYPEIRDELAEIELAIEQYAVLQGQAITEPPASVLDNVLERIRLDQTPDLTALDSEEKHTSSSTSSVAVWILAIGLALALMGIAYLLSQSSSKDEALLQTQQELTTLQEDCEDLRESSEADRRQVAILSNADTRSIVLAGSPNAPDSRAVVFYNSATQQTLLSASSLPAPPTGKQYQLWAIDAEGPQDLGVLNQDISSETLVSVPYRPGVAAFAITLEDEGGKPTPDLSQLQVIGEVGS